jgi:hypothetical protein
MNYSMYLHYLMVTFDHATMDRGINAQDLTIDQDNVHASEVGKTGYYVARS